MICESLKYFPWKEQIAVQWLIYSITTSKTLSLPIRKREYPGRGLGTSLLEFLENEAKQREITHLLVSISSKNVGSIKFHEKNGFRQCGLFQGVGRKNDHTFDMVWMQKAIGKSGPIHEENNSAK